MLTTILTVAPLVFLDAKEDYYPSDIAIHVARTYPTMNYTAVDYGSDPLTLDNLDSLNSLGGSDIYLASTKDLTRLPKFIRGRKPHPKTLQTRRAKSCAVILADKGDEIVDAFYMYFYSFNQGPSLEGHELGDHLGDW